MASFLSVVTLVLFYFAFGLPEEGSPAEASETSVASSPGDPETTAA